ncbi:alpha/beta fold hydrolase [Methanobrevibacter arboriphilus]|uniref:alpha/beta fold hydrolase n=1 Tax=Methanobrevibacter arboriphilus TaxID=39441 RepID=UPI000B08213A|nr:alpha/beta hydrolase [Methanobrevibacter arboriphilus]
MNDSKNILYFEEEGISNNEIIVFIHPNLLSNWIWINQRDYFKDFHCIYLDLPNHGNSYLGNEFSIETSSEIIKELIQEKTHDSRNNNKIKKVNLVGVSLGGQIALYLLSKYPGLIDNVIVSGVNLYEDPEEDDFNNIVSMMNIFRMDILDKKPDKFLIKALLAEYGLEKKYYEFIKESNEKISIESFNSITKESLKFKIPKIENNKTKNKDNRKNKHKTNKNNNINNNIKNDNAKNKRDNNGENLLVLFGTKEYPKVKKICKFNKGYF